MRCSRVLLLFTALVALSLTSSLASAADCQPGDDVLVALQCLDGLTVEEATSTVPGYRQFDMTYVQPVDHSNPARGSFSQRLVLLHRAFNEPMVLQTSGYSIFGVRLTRLAQTFGSNQLQVEHRYFSESTPTDVDWTALNIEQSANDFHRITEAFKQLYDQRWVGTGASKGGMTSVYHRRFFPADLDGTVADVAPLSFSRDDNRYVTFVDEVGGDTYAACRAQLYALQTAMLNQRHQMQSRAPGDYTKLGKAVAVEHAIIELPFAFWQYGNPADPETGCDALPAADADADTLFDYLSDVNAVDGYGDDSMAVFQSYYFQSGTQLGAPGAKLDHLDGVRQHPYSVEQYMPEGGPFAYSNAAMHDVAQWVTSAGDGIMFVYGEFDPWSAGAFPRVGGRDVHTYFVPGGNHGAKFSDLVGDDLTAATATLVRWFDRPALPVDEETEGLSESLEDLELRTKRRFRLP